MKKTITPKQLKRNILFGIYRLLRNDMVARMRANGIAWTKINATLRVLGQKQIVRIEYRGKGVLLTYAHVGLQPKIQNLSGRFQKTFVEPVPEVIGSKPKQP